jgi:hypothetical protein
MDGSIEGDPVGTRGGIGGDSPMDQDPKVVPDIRPPAASSRRPREPDALRGKIWLAGDSERTADDLIDAMEGKDTA